MGLGPTSSLAELAGMQQGFLDPSWLWTLQPGVLVVLEVSSPGVTGNCPPFCTLGRAKEHLLEQSLSWGFFSSFYLFNFFEDSSKNTVLG